MTVFGFWRQQIYNSTEWVTFIGILNILDQSPAISEVQLSTLELLTSKRS